jgi:hypothetical protein
MRPNENVGLIYFDSLVLETSAKVYDFGVRQTESSRQRRIKALEHENEVLTRAVSETRTEIVRLRKLLAAL